MYGKNKEKYNRIVVFYKFIKCVNWLVVVAGFALDIVYDI